MAHRQVVLDTETTGISTEEGHRIIEIGCVELIDRKLTGRHFHYYLNPEREIEAGAFAVHGLSNEFLQDKPLFKSIIQELMDFITDSELIIHNAPFDTGFINYELFLLRSHWKNIEHYCKITDTLSMARQLHVGQRNSLDALCKRYSIDNSKRGLHGALLDANLLAQVYLAMTGGQGSFFDSLTGTSSAENKSAKSETFAQVEKHHLTVLKASTEELQAHFQYLDNMRKQGKCLWETEAREELTG
jgi:DNA polymerase III subunit epsilon